MDTTKQITHKFPNGTEVKGTFEELQTIAKALGQPLTGLDITPRGYYNSATDGLVKISDMHSFHIRRALLKLTTDYMKKVFSGKDTNSEFLKKYGGLVENQTIQDMLNELVKRGDEMVGTTAPVMEAAAAAPPSTKKATKKSATSKK